MSANNWIRFGLLIVFVCLYIAPFHYHHCANLPENIELIKCPSDVFCGCLWVGLSIFSQLSIIQYVGLCGFISTISLMVIERIYIHFYCHNQIGSINYYQFFRIRSWKNDMRGMSCYILMLMVFELIFSAGICLYFDLISTEGLTMRYQITNHGSRRQASTNVIG